MAAAVKLAAKRRPLDLVARYGGEEIIAVLFGGDRAHGQAVAVSVKEAVADLRVEHLASPTRPYVTVSVGVATLEPGANYSHDLAVQLADRALYAAKAGGRDRWLSLGDGSLEDPRGPSEDEFLQTAT